MAPKNKTRERIIEASLELFNAQGERSVTTNHLAAHLGISPGNLYYHFRNKQAIIAELFAQYESRVDMFLRRPDGRALTVEDKTFYLEALLAAMWHYRFLHRDLEHLLEADAELAERYRAFAQRCMVQARGVYQGFVEAGILLMEPAQVEARLLSAGAMPACCATSTNNAAPMATSMWVRMPAALPACSRSHPSRPPSSAATPMRKTTRVVCWGSPMSENSWAATARASAHQPVMACQA